MDLKEIQDFIKAVAKTGATEVKIETEKLKLTVKSPPKGKSNLQTETTVVQQIPMPTHMAPIPSIHMTQPGVQLTPPANTQEQNDAPKKEEKQSKLIEVKAPMVGTFYKRPAPGKPNYVTVGDSIEKGQIVCIIEAMKLFNEIESDVSGKVVKILVEDASPVEYNQTLFLIEPS